jgi:hypothetical protein
MPRPYKCRRREAFGFFLTLRALLGLDDGKERGIKKYIVAEARGCPQICMLSSLYSVLGMPRGRVAVGWRGRTSILGILSALAHEEKRRPGERMSPIGRLSMRLLHQR